MTGLKQAGLSKAQLVALERFLGRRPKAAETKAFFTLSTPGRGATIENLPAAAKGFRVLMMCHARQRARKGTITVRQERGRRILGGNTFVLRAVPKQG
jgi:hypothetical protein